MTTTYVAPMTAPLLRRREVIELLGISLWTLDRLVASGQLPAVRIGGSVRFRPEDVRGFVDRSVEASAPKAPEGSTSHDRVMTILTILTLIVALAQLHAAYRPQTPAFSAEEITHLVDALSKMEGPAQPGEEQEEPKGSGGG